MDPHPATWTPAPPRGQGPLLHVGIVEDEKPSSAELGRVLTIGKTDIDPGDRFDDLDEICQRCEIYAEISREIGSRSRPAAHAISAYLTACLGASRARHLGACRGISRRISRRYIEPLVENAKEMQGHRKYHRGTIEQVPRVGC